MAAQLKLDAFNLMDDGACDARIRAAKSILGDRLCILGHHYQRDEAFQHADFTGDSLKLSRLAAETTAEYIVFCGVHFMAEVADIVTGGTRNVILPDLAAGCSMADLANLIKVRRCWKELAEVFDPDTTVTPVTYINSAADLKGFCGEHGGIVCTSSNARAVLEWSFARREKVLFFPDQHLGRNTAVNMGIGLDEMVVWDFTQPMGGATVAQLQRAKLILWKGFCSVHQMFKPEHIDAFRARVPHGKVISHPENSYEVCQHSDEIGSTEAILRTVRASAPGTHRAESCQSPRRRNEAQRRHGGVHELDDLHVLDHVPHRSAAPCLGARQPGQRPGGQSHPCPRGGVATRPPGAGPDARSGRLTT